MNAYVVSDIYGNCGTEIVFAETRGKAVALCYRDEVFEDYEWTELHARRFKAYDKYYNGENKVDFWLDEEHRTRLVKEFGWSCIDPIDSMCPDCPAQEWCDYGVRIKGGDNE